MFGVGVVTQKLRQRQEEVEVEVVVEQVIIMLTNHRFVRKKSSVWLKESPHQLEHSQQPSHLDQEASGVQLLFERQLTLQ